MIGTLLLALWLPASGATVDVASARARLAERFETLLADTSTPARTIATVAWALDEPEKIGRAAATLVQRQQKNGAWAETSSAAALADQAFAVALVAPLVPAAGRRGAEVLLKAQGREGGWSTSLSRRGFEDTISTALAVHALAAARPVLPAREVDVSLRRARAFVETRQDPDTGLIGDESRGLGHWSSTAAGLWVLETGDDPRDLATRRATMALQGTDAFSRPARQPLYGLFFFRRLTGTTAQPELPPEMARHQAPDGTWPASRLQNDADATQTTAMLLIANRPATATINTSAPPHLAWRAIGGGSHVLITLPAEPADLLLVERPQTTNALVVGYDAHTVAAALLGDADRPWIAPLGEALRNLHAGPVQPDAIGKFIRGSRPAESLLQPADFLAELGRLDEKAERRLARQLTASLTEDGFAEMRRAWSHENDAELSRLVEAGIPDVLRPAVAGLRAKATERLLARCQQGPCTILLDAWLALGPDGVLARLHREQAVPRP